MENPEARLKRMKMRSWRRGTKEMDLLLGPWADEHLGGLSPEGMDTYDALLEENDQDLMAWVLGQAPAPAHLSALLDQIAAFGSERLRKV
jgi:antitoxin CptB